MAAITSAVKLQDIKNEFYFYTLIMNYYFCCSVPQLCLTLCYHMDCNMAGSPVLYCLLQFAQIHVH